MGDSAQSKCSRRRARLVGASAVIGLLLSGCGGSEPSARSAHDADEPPADVAVTDGAEPSEPEASPWLSRLQEEGMLTYQVEGAAGEAPIEVRMQVQQRVSAAGNVAIRLVPIGTPLGETPIFAQWLIGTPESMSALEEGASFTTPGFVPIDERGRLRTEAAGSEVWRIESRWLRAGSTASGTEVAVGWTLRERVGVIAEPIDAEGCVRLERSDASASSTLLVCAGLGVVERVERSGDDVCSRWRLVAVGERPAELE